MDASLALMDVGGGVGFFGTILIGTLAGWVAEKLTRADHGLLTNMLIGVFGAYVGGVLANVLGLRLDEVFQGWFWGNLVVSTIGAVLLIATYRLLRGRTA